MLDFGPVYRKEMTYHQLGGGLRPPELRGLTNEIVDVMLGLIAGCEDADVTFVPVDPAPHDEFAATSQEIGLVWTLAHVLVHVTATAEDACFVAAELARGVPFHGRSRYEVPWQSITTLEQCRHRLEESRRMRLASLDIWPDEPHLDNSYRVDNFPEPLNPPVRILWALEHEYGHLGQIEEIVRQAGRGGGV
jgi:uncharacterized damage-inducible protein DinB